MPTDIIKRALELASESSSILVLERKLRAEGYDHVHEHLSGRSIRAQITNLLHRIRKPARVR